MEDTRCLPRQIALVILLIVALAIAAKTARPRGMSESRIETLPWPERVSNLSLMGVGVDDRIEKIARHSDNLLMPEAIK